MLKKIFRLIRNLFIGLIWIFLYVTIINSELITLWNFNLLSVHSWNTIGYFWDAGGVIKSTKDFLFLFNLALVPILWFWGWRILARQDYISLLLLPYTIYNNYMIKRCIRLQLDEMQCFALMIYLNKLWMIYKALP